MGTQIKQNGFIPGPPPPSYESLFGRARAIKQESNGNVDFVKRIIFLLVGTSECVRACVCVYIVVVKYFPCM